MFGNLFNQRRVTKDDQGGSTTTVQKTESAVLPLGVTPVVVNQTETIKTQNTNPPAQSASVSPVPTEEGGVEKGLDPETRQNVTALSRLDPRATQVLNQAQQEAKRMKLATIELEQLLYGLFYDSEIFKVLEECGLDVAKTSQEIQSKETQGTFDSQPTMSAGVKKIFEEGYNLTKLRSASFVSPEDVLLAIFSDPKGEVFFKEKNVTRESVEQKLSKSASYSVAKRSTLEKFGLDLTAEAKDGVLDPVAGRDKEIERLVHILLRRTKNNPIIIGEAGVGKTAVVEGLAQKIVKGDVPKELKDRRIIQLDLASMVAGASHRGEFEERLKGVIKEAQASIGQIVLFIDEIHTLIGTGDTQGALDASNIIKPYLARGQLQLIGTTTTAEYRKYFEKDKAFERRFQPILVDEPDEDAAVEMLKVLQPKYEKFHNVTFTPEALTSSVHLSKKYVGERYLPDKAVDLLDEAAADVKLQVSSGKRNDASVVKSDIEKVVSGWTGIPITKLTEDEGQKLIKLEEIIHKRFVDQEEAVAAVAEAVRRGRIGLSAANRPIASFIFLGPTGVGKTELAKTLAEIMFGKEEAMIRLDMSEYMEKHEVAKLIGAPPGYVGYEEGGQLTEAVRAKPYSIVLLDEVEKAHPDVFNILLQLLEDGRLTDNKGNTISFKNTIIIATSNLGSALIQQELSTTDTQNEQVFNQKFSELTKKLVEELHKFFRPELLNRFDELVVFKPLAQKDMSYIAKLGIEKTRKLLKEQGFELTITDGALGELAKEGYDPIYGARPLRRLIQTAVENPIAVLLIGKTFIAGDTILIDFDAAKNEFTFTKAAPKPEGQTEEKKAEDGDKQSKDGETPKSETPQNPDENPSSAIPADTGATNGNTQDKTSDNHETAPSVPPPPPTQGTDGTQMMPA